MLAYHVCEWTTSAPSQSDAIARSTPSVRSAAFAWSRPERSGYPVTPSSSRGVPKARYAADDWYDVWLPDLSPSPATVKLGQHAGTERDWGAFRKRYRAEMARPEPGRLLDLLAALSHTADFSVGCYCADESRCHRSVLRALLVERGAQIG